MSANEKATPMMKQFFRMKKEYPDAVLFFRMGDFYETFYDDAKITAEALGITLTSRDKKGADRVPLAGIPYHALDTYLTKMVKQGFKVAICEQMEDPKKAKGLVARDVVRVVTPGTVLDGNMLSEGSNNFLVGIKRSGNSFGLSFADVSTGEFYTTQFEDDSDHSRLLTEIIRLAPAECVLPNELVKDSSIMSSLKSALATIITPLPDSNFDLAKSYARLTKHLGLASLDAVGCEELSLAVGAAGAVLSYLEETQKGSLSHIDTLSTYFATDTLILDSTTLRNLEISRNIRDGGATGTLLSVLDRTKTPMGARLLKDWLHKPLLSVPAINKRLDGVSHLLEDPLLRSDIRGELEGVKDMPRLLSRIVYGSANARDLVAMRVSLSVLPGLKELLKEAASSAPILCELHDSLDTLEDVHTLIGDALADEAPATLREGGIIRDGYNEQLDGLRAISREGKGWIAKLEAQEKARTGIKSLKVRYNKVFGYYIEITKANAALAPDDYIRKQTLTGSERFITPELKEKEETVLTARDRAVGLEYDLFVEVRAKAAAESSRIQKTSKALAALDVLLSLAEAASYGSYCRPGVNDSDTLAIMGGRHPVVEHLASEPFIPNDIDLNGTDRRFIVLTGPNMAGKSTYMRQVALITIMAQLGSFVPASSASIGVVDRVFTRVGAFDDLVRGQSTFMVEMTELANILHNATPRSLVILDEIGRGTSTFDGLSIAWAVVEHLAGRSKGTKTLFATHYHHITELGDIMDGVKNFHITVKEEKDEMTFLRTVIPGPANKSYGIQVAKLAGVPKGVIERAKEVLKTIEEDEALEVKNGMEQTLTKADNGVRKKARRPGPRNAGNIMQTILFDPDAKARKGHPLVDELKDMDIHNLTPIQALSKLEELKRKAETNKDAKDA